MSKLKSLQKDKICQFMIFTQSSEKTAVSFLFQNDWNLGISVKGSLNRKKLEQLYNRYKNPKDENKIGKDGILQLCDDLALNPTSINVLVVWKFRAATQCKFPKQEFMDGFAFNFAKNPKQNGLDVEVAIAYYTWNVLLDFSTKTGDDIKMKRQGTNWEKTFAEYISDKGLVVFKLCKEFFNSIRR
ncbi:unnamed protein product [Nyctereutes procyonoides]|uniref:DCN1-like protein n=1 Tax=Nyctereutes procyonoides TaxID=34880 RepID=A0A811YHB6_NYCPR|nr:unnamed protein product [Nyctereutes procyonoides]